MTKYVIGKDVSLKKKLNEPHRVRVKCANSRCDWLLFAGIDNVLKNFIIKTYHLVHKCYGTNKNKLCNNYFLAKLFKNRIMTQPSKKIIEIQNLCNDELKVYVGKTTRGRAKEKVLKVLVGDSITEFAKLHDYCDEIRSNQGTACFAQGKTLEELAQFVKNFRKLSIECAPDVCLLIGAKDGRVMKED